MRLTSFTDYGLRMLMYMAGQPTRSFSTAELALELGLSRNHLTKILQHLSRAGFVTTRRGGGGGAQLSREATDISLGEVVRSLEAKTPLVECLAKGGGACALTARCRLKGKLLAAQKIFLEELNRSTLADIAITMQRVA